MTDAEIIKALKCCTDTGINACDDCPFQERCLTGEFLETEAIDLIVRQKAEIDFANKRADMWHREAELNAAELIKMQAEVERLKLITTNNPYCVSIGTADIFTANHEEYEKLLAKISAEAIKELAKRLKSDMSYSYLLGREFCTGITIDNLVKEMVGEG